jgi:hypothetical protein
MAGLVMIAHNGPPCLTPPNTDADQRVPGTGRMLARQAEELQAERRQRLSGMAPTEAGEGPQR